MEKMNAAAKNRIREIVLRERTMALSEREWKHRLRGYGYGIMDTDEGCVVTSLVQGAALCRLQSQAAA